MDDGISRLSRLTSILLQLQARRVVSATSLAAKYDVSTRTIYRDIKALELAGVPIQTEEGKGYSLMEGYRLPPVMFSEDEANALITAEQLVLRNKDASLVAHYTSAATKIKAVLRQATKDAVNLLSERIVLGYNEAQDRSSDTLASLQKALTGFLVVEIEYRKQDAETHGWRAVEPFALLGNEQGWLLAARCRLRNDFRLFRLDRMRALRVRTENFTPHNLKLEDYLLRLRAQGNR